MRVVIEGVEVEGKWQKQDKAIDENNIQHQHSTFTPNYSHWEGVGLEELDKENSVNKGYFTRELTKFEDRVWFEEIVEFDIQYIEYYNPSLYPQLLPELTEVTIYTHHKESML